MVFRVVAVVALVVLAILVIAAFRTGLSRFCVLEASKRHQIKSLH
jgi:hypothetical protein